jgi:hypothetical protein
VPQVEQLLVGFELRLVGAEQLPVLFHLQLEEGWQHDHLPFLVETGHAGRLWPG